MIDFITGSVNVKYILVLANKTFSIPMFRDLWKRDDVTLYLVNHEIIKPLSILRKIHTDPRWRDLLYLPGRDYWERHLLTNINKDTCFLFTTEAITFLSENLLMQIKNHQARPKMVLLIMDSLHAHSAHLKWARKLIDNFPWDVRLSYDARDCKEFGFDYMGCNIYSFDTNSKPSNFVSDLYYIGREKAGRNAYIKCMYEYFDERDVICNFHLTDKKYCAYKYIGKSKHGLKYHLLSQEKYNNVLSDVLSTNCILEVVQKGQKAQTARYYEAVCANKKLLTNNHYVKELPFYDERYMKVFDNLYDIDVDWIKRREHIDYGYNGEFSPVRILDILQKMENA